VYPAVPPCALRTSRSWASQCSGKGLPGAGAGVRVRPKVLAGATIANWCQTRRHHPQLDVPFRDRAQGGRRGGQERREARRASPLAHGGRRVLGFPVQREGPSGSRRRRGTFAPSSADATIANWCQTRRHHPQFDVPFRYRAQGGRRGPRSAVRRVGPPPLRTADLKAWASRCSGKSLPAAGASGHVRPRPAASCLPDTVAPTRRNCPGVSPGGRRSGIDAQLKQRIRIVVVYFFAENAIMLAMTYQHRQAVR
jgi:hypothetical protein